MQKPFIHNKVKRRKVYRLREQGLTYKEIAKEMGMSWGTIRKAYLLEKATKTVTENGGKTKTEEKGVVDEGTSSSTTYPDYDYGPTEEPSAYVTPEKNWIERFIDWLFG